MKFKEWIKNLKMPRLIIEALFIFGSVYMALILEADRSRDFEREIVIGELRSILETNKKDSTDLMLYFGDNFENFKSIYARDSILIYSIHEGKELDLEIKKDIKAGFWGLMPSSKLFEFKQIENPMLNEHRFLINDRNLIDKMMEIDYYMEWLKDHNENHAKSISGLKQEFKSKMRFEDKIDNPDVDLIITSELFYNTMSDVLSYRQVKLDGSKVVLDLYAELNTLILQEIGFQKEAMNGIF
jgi:hypothetical protein